MKTLADNTEVISRIYYYLLDWNEQNEWLYMADEFGKARIKELNIKEFWQLFKYATTQDYRNLISK